MLPKASIFLFVCLIFFFFFLQAASQFFFKGSIYLKYYPRSKDPDECEQFWFQPLKAGSRKDGV